MARRAICSFCGKEIPMGTGKVYVTKTGKVLWFCSRKCEVNMLELKRSPKKVRWTKEYMKEKLTRVKKS